MIASQVYFTFTVDGDRPPRFPPTSYRRVEHLNRIFAALRVRFGSTHRGDQPVIGYTAPLHTPPPTPGASSLARPRPPLTPLSRRLVFSNSFAANRFPVPSVHRSRGSFAGRIDSTRRGDTGVRGAQIHASQRRASVRNK